MPPKSTIFWLLGCIAWALLVLWLSLIPHPPKVRLPLLSWDKFQHACAYALLTLLAGNSAARLWPARRGHWLVSGGVALVFGAMIEGLQYLEGKGRQADYHDILANTTGILAVFLGVMLWRRFGSGRRSRI